MTTAAVVLAAGGGRRFSGAAHKLLSPFRGRPVVAWAVGAARDAGLDETIVVVGAVDLSAVLPDDVVLVQNHDWAAGQAVSLRAGWTYAEHRGHEAVVVGLGDQPLVTADAWRRVAASTSAIAVATYDGARRNPVRLACEVWPLLPVDGDEGARALMRKRHDLVSEIPCDGMAADIDTMEDLERWS